MLIDSGDIQAMEKRAKAAVVTSLSGFKSANLVGTVDLTMAGTVAISGLDSYHDPRPIKGMAYAKPELLPRSLDFQATCPRPAI